MMCRASTEQSIATDGELTLIPISIVRRMPQVVDHGTPICLCSVSTAKC
jgi:hypothetical protein